MRANSKPHIDPNKNSDVDASLGHVIEINYEKFNDTCD